MPMQVSVTAENADPEFGGERVIEENINNTDAHRIAIGVHASGEVVTLTPWMWDGEQYVLDTAAAVEVGAKAEAAPKKKAKKDDAAEAEG